MSRTAERDYRETINLPKTDFPMKADLPAREPDRVAWWEDHGTYRRRLERNAQAPPWILHDGPPYSNGNLHMGHFLNMVLKDVFVKIALLDGRWAMFVPGWDMHGLPIELETLKHLGIKDFRAIDPLKLRAQCKERALYWLDRQREARMRMGTFGTFDHPYRTIDPSYEATIVEALADLAEHDQIYKGLRSTLWCVHDETALAEAEIEYEPTTSPSVYVRFGADPQQRVALAAAFGLEKTPARVSILIWTTTPWTLPANAAIALRPDAAYGMYRLDDEGIILATALAESVLRERYGEAKLLGTVKGEALESLRVRHSFMDRDAVIVLADYVDLETGTGAVHTAPGHGADDFETGLKYGLPIINPVDATGLFTDEAGPYAGMNIWKANDKIIKDLDAAKALFRTEPYEHSYPHCWRCHNPVIFRATMQWFIAMDQNRLRARCIDAADTVAYTPAWGRERMRQMLETHPEWCVSRQRTWGTPIPALICSACRQAFLDARVARRAAERFAAEGADSWWRDPIEMFLPDGLVCPHCGASDFEKEQNIVDIWFESGVTHLAVLGKTGLPWPSDLVVEGPDQFRGWFRSSLVTGVAIKGAAPYARLVKNGWVNDEQGRPMSKSRGTGYDAEDAMGKWGADVLRLWAASVEFVDDVRFGPNVISQVGNVYRNIRYRMRYMLSNLFDLPADAIVSRERLEPIDQIACNVADDFVHRIKALYDAFSIHDAYLATIEFDGAMSSLYIDALKEPLYTRAADDPRRRSAQSALLYILKRFLTAVAPVLSFTAEEAWQFIPEHLRDGDSVFDSSFDANEQPSHFARDVALWNVIRELRARVASNSGVRDFEAKLRLDVTPALHAKLEPLGDNLREALVVSALELVSAEGEGEAVVGFALDSAEGSKCVRCWKYRVLGSDSEHPKLCAECAAIVRAID